MKTLTRKIVLSLLIVITLAALALGITWTLKGDGIAPEPAFAASTVATVDSNEYTSLEDAWNYAAKYTTSSSKQKTIKLVNSAKISLSSTLTLSSGYYVTLDLNGCKIDVSGATGTAVFDIYGCFTLTDSSATLSSTKSGTFSSTYTTSGSTRTSYFYLYSGGQKKYMTYKSGYITGGKSSANGASVIKVNAGATCNMTGGTISDCSYSLGAALYVTGGGSSNRSTFNMYGGVIANNSCSSSAAGVFANYSYVNIYGGAIVNNDIYTKSSSYLNSGAAIYADNYTNLVLGMSSGTNSYGWDPIISGNYSYAYGGGIYVESTSSKIDIYDGTSIVCNSAQLYGGGVYSAGSFHMYGGYICENTASSYGGGLGVAYSAYLYDGTISNNSCTGSGSMGGGVYVSGIYTFNMSGGTVSNNTAVRYGGGLSVSGSAGATLTGGEISNNSVSGTYSGGGAAVQSGATIRIQGVTISNNTAAANGGGVSVLGTLTMSSGSVSGNSAESGGGIYVSGTGTGTLTGGTVTDNNATYCGGIYVDGGTLSLKNTEISSNTADKADYGAGVYNGGEVSAQNKVIINGNTSGGKDCNYAFASGSYMSLTANLSSGSYIGVYGATTGTQITASESTTEYYRSSYMYFALDGNNYSAVFVLFDSSARCVMVMTVNDGANAAARVDFSDGSYMFYNTFGSALEAATASSSSARGTLVLLTDIKMSDQEDADSDGYSIPSGRYVTVDLNGHTIYADGVYHVFHVYGYLYLRDSTGVYASYTGSLSEGAYIDKDTGTVTTIYKKTDPETKITSTYSYTSGSITGTDSYVDDEEHNGVICVSAGGRFYMYGGSLSKNRSYEGSAVALYGSGSKAYFYMYGGAMSANEGDALYVDYSYAYIYGGLIVSTGSGWYGSAARVLNGGYFYTGTSSSSECDVVISHNSGRYGAVDFETESTGQINAGYFEFNSTVYGGALYLYSGTSVTVKGGLFANNTASYAGGAFSVAGSLTMTGGEAYANVAKGSGTANGGGAVYINGGSFVMNGGALTDNSATSSSGYGGAVSVYIGEFMMTGGEISGNSACYGGAVSEATDSIFDFDGGIISGNSSSNSGGAVYLTYGELYMTSGTLSGNSSKSDGGAVFGYHSVMEIDGGEIYGNTAAVSAGALYAYNGTLDVNGGEIYGNTANSSTYGGGAIAVHYGALNVTDGEIYGNAAPYGYGGAFYIVSESSIEITGGSVYSNTAAKGAGGIYTEVNVSMKGSVIIQGNTSDGEVSNVALSSGVYVNLTGDVEKGSYIGVTVDGERTQITTSETSTAYYKSSYTYFYIDNLANADVGYDSAAKCVVVVHLESTAARVEYSDGSYEYNDSYVTALDLATADGGTVVLTNDVYCDDYSSSLGSETGYTVPSGKELTLDLNGHSIYLSDEVTCAFTVEGTFTLTDSTGRYETYSGSGDVGVYDNGDGTFATVYYKSDEETGETSILSYTSGGITASYKEVDTIKLSSAVGVVTVCESAEFDMLGGSIVLNSSEDGATVMMQGTKDDYTKTTAKIYGGSISGNNDYFGAIYCNYGNLWLYGGIVANNTTMWSSAVNVAGNFYMGKTATGEMSAYVKDSPTVSGNEYINESARTNYGAGVYVPTGGSVEMDSGTIEYNAANGSNGAGAYFWSTSVITGGLVGYNSSDYNDCGLMISYQAGTASVSGLTICGNKSGGYGPGFTIHCTCTMSDCRIFDNSTESEGGGIYVGVNGNLTLKDVEVYDNEASVGGGIYCVGSLTMSGYVSVRDNVSFDGTDEVNDNVYLSSGNTITLSSSLTEGSYVGVSFANSVQTQITSTESGTTRYKSSIRYFRLDDEGAVAEDGCTYVIAYDDNPYLQRIHSEYAAVRVDFADGNYAYYTDFSEAFSYAVTAEESLWATMVLVSDVTITAEYTVAEGEYLTLDLNGHSVISGKDGTRAFTVNGHFVLEDSEGSYGFGIEYDGDEGKVVDNEDGTFTTYYSTYDETTGVKTWNFYTSGAITGFSLSGTGRTNGGAVYVTSGATFVMYGGSVVCNYGDFCSGVELYGSETGGLPAYFYMYGGSISGNTVDQYGALIIIEAEAYIYSGIFAGNDAEKYDAAIHLSTNAVLYLGYDGDEEVLDLLQESDPDAYRAGVVVSENHNTSTNADSTVIRGNEEDKYFGIYSRTEISSNSVSAYSERGVVNTMGTTYFYGGKVVNNVAGATGTVTLYANADQGYYFNYSGNTIITDNHDHSGESADAYLQDGVYMVFSKSFSGNVGIIKSVPEGENGRVLISAAGDFDADTILSFVYSDEGHCLVIDKEDGCLYLTNMPHSTGSDITLVLEDGEVVAYYICTNCGATAGKAEKGIDITFGYDCNGKIVAVAKSGDDVVATMEMTSGICVTDGSGTYMWYPDVDSALAALDDDFTDAESLTMTLLSDVNGNIDLTTAGASIKLDLNGYDVYGNVYTSSDITFNGGHIYGNLTVNSTDEGVEVDISEGAVYGDVTVSGSGASLAIGSDGTNGYVSGDIAVSGENASISVTGTTLEGDVTVSGGDVAIDLTDAILEGATYVTSGSAEMTLDGSFVYGNITVGTDDGESASLTIKNSSEEGAEDSTVYGQVKTEGESKVSLKGGNYAVDAYGADESFDSDEYAKFLEESVADGYKILVSYDSAGGAVYTIVSDNDIDSLSGAYIATYDEDGKETGKTYYETAADAIIAAQQNGGTVVLTSDADAGTVVVTGELVIDLNGHKLTADFAIDADDGYDPDEPVSLTIVDSSSGEKGTIIGTITVTGQSEDVMEGDTGHAEENSYEGTLSIVGSAVGNDTKFDFTELSSSEDDEVIYDIEYDEQAGTYGIGTTHEHTYSPEWTRNADGTYTVRFVCVCGKYESAGESDEKGEDGERIVTVTGVTATYDPIDGSVTYEATVNTTLNGEEETISYSETIVPAVMVTYTDGDEEKVLYFEDLSDALEYIDSLFADEESGASDVTLVLLEDTDLGSYTVSGGDLTINTNGYDLGGAITVEGGAGLDIKDETVTVGTDENSTEINHGDGSTVNASVSAVPVTDENGETVYPEVGLTSGTYTNESVLDVIADGYVAVWNDDGSFTIMSEDDAKSAAQATVTSSDGNEKYYMTLETALSDAETGDTVTVINDIGDNTESLSVTVDVEGKDITLDLNGKTLYADITVRGDGNLTITDESDSSDGILCGSVYGDGDITITGGTYTTDVGEYVERSKAVFVKTGESGTLYTIVDKYGSDVEGAAAYVTYTGADGNDVVVYYDSIEDAVSALKDGDTLVLLEDVDSPSALNFTSDSEMNVTLDLNGHTVGADVSAENNVSLTITDSTAGRSGVGGDYELGKGSVTGTLSGDVTIDSGSYAVSDDFTLDNLLSYVDEDSYTVYVQTNEDGDAVYTVVPVKEAEKSAGAAVTYTDGYGNEHTIYFDDASSAIAWASENSSDDSPVYVILYEDVTSGETGDDTVEIGTEDGNANVVIDLNGHEISANIEVEAGSTLTIEGTGTVTGSLTGGEGSGGTPDGKIVVTGGTYTEDVSEYAGEGYGVLVTTDDDGNTVYEVLTESEARDGAAASVTDETTGVTTYYEDINEALEALDGLVSGEDTKNDTFTLTLWDDVSGDDLGENGKFEIGGNTTLDLNGNTVETDVYVAPGSDAEIDLNNGTITGNIVVGDADGEAGSGNGAAKLTISDSGTSEDAETIGTGSVEGLIESNNDANEITVTGGTFASPEDDDEENDGYSIDRYLAEDGDLVIVIGENGSYTVVPESLAEVASSAYVEDRDGDGTYFGDLQDAIDWAAEQEGDIKVVLTGDVETDEIIIPASSDITLDLAGHTLTVDGGITVGEDDVTGEEESGSATLTVTDSSADGSEYGIGTGAVIGDIEKGNDSSEITVEGGSYSYDVGDYLPVATGCEDTSYVIVVGDDGMYVVVPSEYVESFAGAYTVEYDEDGEEIEDSKTYYESAEDAIRAVAKEGGTVVLLDDAELTDGTEIISDVVIDLNGHDLTVDITVDTDTVNGGSLTFKDSTADSSEEPPTGGTVSGNIAVTGDSTSAEGDTYKDALVFEDGTYDEDGSLTVDLSGINGNGNVYELTYDDETGNYVIEKDSDHEHSYTIERWTLNDDGSMTLKLVCSCGEVYGTVYTVAAGDVTIEDNGDGTYTFSGTASDGDGKPYYCEMTVEIAATVETKDGTHYFESLEDAVNFVESAENGSDLVIVLNEDVDEDITISGDVTIDTDGHTIAGSFDIEDDGSLTIVGDGVMESDITVEDGGALTAEGGTYTGDITAESGSEITFTDGAFVESVINADDNAEITVTGGTFSEGNEELVKDAVEGTGLVILVDEDGNLVVTSEDDAKDRAAASVTKTDSDGNETTTYYESLEDAVEALEDGDTLTLWDDAESIYIEGHENVTVDLNGYDASGDVTFDGCSGAELNLYGGCVSGTVSSVNGSDVTITGDGEVDTLKKDDESTFVLQGGTYDDWDSVSEFVDGDFVILVNDDFTYSVMTEGDAEDKSEAKVETTYTDEYENEITETLYFEDLQNALDYAASLNGGEDTATTVVMTGDSIGDVNVSGDAVLDLNGHTLDGDVVVEDGVRFTVTDSDDNKSGAVEGQLVTKETDSDVTVEGGTFYDDSWADCIGDDLVTVENADGSYTVMTEEEAKDCANVFVTVTDGDTSTTETYYFESVEDAVGFASDIGGKVTLNSDVSADGTILIDTDVEIDLNGYTLDADIIIYADGVDGEPGEGGSLKVTDSSVDSTGEITGTITLIGSGESTEDGENAYADTLVFDGVTPGGNLIIDLSDLSDGSGKEYWFGETENGTYGITDEHEHDYDIEIWTLNADNTVTLRFMCACGEYLINSTGRIIEYDADVTITNDYENSLVIYEATVTTDEGNTYTFTTTVDMDGFAAYVESEDGDRTYYVNLEDALAAAEDGDTVVLLEDFSGDVYVSGNKDITIDLAGNDIAGSVFVESGSTLEVTDTAGGGEIEAAVTVDGALILDGVDVTLTDDMTVSANGSLIIEDTVTIDLSGSTLTAAPEVTDGSELIIKGGEGSKIVLNGDSETGEDSAVVIDGDITLDVNGNTFSGVIDVEDGASLTVEDSSIRHSGSLEGDLNVSGGATAALYDDTYSDGVSVNIADEDSMLSTNATADGRYYEVITKKQHVEEIGHGYDAFIGYVLDPSTATLTLTFECACGETLTVEYKMKDTDYTATADEEGYVTVGYDINWYVEAPNGVIYTFVIEGESQTLDEPVSYGESNATYAYDPVTQAGCENTGLDTYTYKDADGGASGIVVKVVTPVQHSLTEGTVEVNGETYKYYVCETCGCIFMYENVSSDLGYDNVDDLKNDIEKSQSFDDTKNGLIEALEDIFGSYDVDFGDDVLAAYEELLRELESASYELTNDGNRKEYLDDLIDKINDIFDEADFMLKTSEQEILAEDYLTEVYEGIKDYIESMNLDGQTEEDILAQFDAEWNEILNDLSRVSVETKEEAEEIYSYFIEKAVSDLLKNFTSAEGSEDGGTLSGSVIVVGGSSSGDVRLVIQETEAGGRINNALEEGNFVDMTGEDRSAEEIAEELSDYGVVAVFDISLETSDGTEITMFNGTYVVTIVLPETLSGRGDLVIVYVGDDGRIEVYATSVSDGGTTITFTTTHFSSYVLLGTGEEGAATGEKEHDLMPAIIALAVVDGVLLILGIVLLIVLLMKKGKIGGKKNVASLGMFALLSVVPAGGIAITVVLGVLALAFIAADIYLIYGIFTAVPVVEYVENGAEGDVTIDTTGEVTLSESDENSEKEE